MTDGSSTRISAGSCYRFPRRLQANGSRPTSGPAWDAVPKIRQAIVNELRQQLAERNTRYLDEETEKLERWADDQKQTLEQELRELDRKIREARKSAKLAVTLSQKLDAQKEQRELDALRSRKRRLLFEAQDTVDSQRDELIGNAEKQLSQRTTLETVFAFRWTLT